jgi:hypothetical protein
MRSSNSNTPQPLERFLACVGFATCGVITLAIWSSMSAQQPMWPLPGLYFIELVLLSMVSAGMFLRSDRHRSAVAWTVAGAFSGFVVIAAWSVGLFYLPVTILFGVSAIVSDRRGRRTLARQLALCVIAGLAQAVLMLAAVRVLYPGAIF